MLLGSCDKKTFFRVWRNSGSGSSSIGSGSWLLLFVVEEIWVDFLHHVCFLHHLQIGGASQRAEIKFV